MAVEQNQLQSNYSPALQTPYYYGQSALPLGRERPLFL